MKKYENLRVVYLVVDNHPRRIVQDLVNNYC